jgi:hypothetical protein
MVNSMGQEIGDRPGCLWTTACECEACQEDWVEAAKDYIAPEYLINMSVTGNKMLYAEYQEVEDRFRE